MTHTPAPAAWLDLFLALAACDPDAKNTVPDAEDDTATSTTGSVEDTSSGEASDSGDTSEPGPTEPPLIDCTPAPTEAAYLDPERGLLTWVSLTEPGDLSWVREGGHSLAYAGVVLQDFGDSDISEEFLAQLGAGFDAVRAAGIKVVLRFHYSGTTLGDAEHSRILEHIEQLAPVISAHSDVIYVVQAGFIGAWGEWHSSEHGIDRDYQRKAVLDALLEAVPSNRMLQVRTPAFKSDLYGGPLTASEAYSDRPEARIGQHNDCFLASETDYGTYRDGDIDGDKAFLEAEARFVPVGGETCRVNAPRSECATALEELERFHYRFLNALYHPDVLAGWEAEGCMDTIDAHLGHRIEVRGAEVSASLLPGGRLRLALALHNAGWGGLVNPRPLHVHLSSGDWSASVAVPVGDLDLRRLEGGGSAEHLIVLQTPGDVPLGPLSVAVSLPDPELAHDVRYTVRPAVDDAHWDAETGRVTLPAVVSVEAEGTGAVNPDATELSVVAVLEPED